MPSKSVISTKYIHGIRVDETKNFLHVRVRSPSGLTNFRTDDIGRAGYTMRTAAMDKNGNWVTQAYKLAKNTPSGKPRSSGEIENDLMYYVEQAKILRKRLGLEV